MTEAPNAELAYQVLDQIDAHPETWNQRVWDCGTAACFAGWAVRLSGCRVRTDNFLAEIVAGPKELIGRTVCDAAGVVLRSDGYGPDGTDLFSPDNDREALGEIVYEIFGPRPVTS